MENLKIFYEDNNKTHIATGEKISEDDLFIEINDKFEGKIKIGKKFIIKIRKEGEEDGIRTFKK